MFPKTNVMFHIDPDECFIDTRKNNDSLNLYKCTSFIKELMFYYNRIQCNIFELVDDVSYRWIYDTFNWETETWSGIIDSYNVKGEYINGKKEGIFIAISDNKKKITKTMYKKGKPIGNRSIKIFCDEFPLSCNIEHRFTYSETNKVQTINNITR